MKQSWTIASIVNFLTANGFKKQDIAERIGKNESTLSRIINGKQKATPGILNKLLMAYQKELEGAEQPLVETEEYNVGEAIREIRAISEVMLSAIAEILAKETGQSATVVRDQLVELVRKRRNTSEPGT